MLLTNLLALYDLKSFGGVLLLVVDVGNGCLFWMLVVGVSAGGLYLVLVILLLLVGLLVLVLVVGLENNREFRHCFCFIERFVWCMVNAPQHNSFMYYNHHK